MIKIKNIHIEYDTTVLDCEEMKLMPSQLTLIKGESGSGKTTLLQRIGFINQDCDIFIDNNKISNIDQVRRTKVGFVLQSNDIIPYLSVEENISLYAKIANVKCDKEDVVAVMEAVELDVPLCQAAMSLSLGERQRLAIACALIKKPLLLILDEPTASLDMYHKEQIFRLMKKIAKTGCYVVFTSHENDAYKYADRVYEIIEKKLMLIKGCLVDDFVACQDKALENKKSLVLYCSRLFGKHHNKIRILIILAMIVNMLIINFANMIVLRNHDNLKNELFNQSERILLINNSNKRYVDDFDKPLHLNKRPFIKMTLQEDMNVYVLPYFDYSIFNDEIDTLVSNDRNGIYISYDLRNRLDNISLNRNICLPLVLYGADGVQRNIRCDAELSGILKKGVIQNYSKESRLFVYMPYNMMKELYDYYFKYNYYYAYIEQYDSYNALKLDSDRLVEQGLTTSIIGIDDDRLNNTLDMNMRMIIRLNVMLATLILLMLIAIQLYYINKRKKEITLLRLNGITSWMISSILLIDSIVGGVIAIFVLMMFAFLNFIGGVYVLCSFAYIVAIVVLLYIIGWICINRINIEKEIRISMKE